MFTCDPSGFFLHRHQSRGRAVAIGGGAVAVLRMYVAADQRLARMQDAVDDFHNSPTA